MKVKGGYVMEEKDDIYCEVTIDAELYQKLEVIAKAHECTIEELCEYYITKRVHEWEKEHGAI